MTFKVTKSKNTKLDRLASVEKYNSRGGQSIWDRQYLLVPINDEFHWSLAVVCIAPPEAPSTAELLAERSRLGLEEEEAAAAAALPPGVALSPAAAAAAPKMMKKNEQPRTIDLLYFDSLGHRGRSRRHCDVIIEYLNYKWSKEHIELNEGENPNLKWPYQLPKTKQVSAKSIIFSTKFIIFNAKFIIFSTKFIIFNAKFIIFT